MGRRWGKTVLGGALSLATANAGGSVAWIVPTYKNGRSLWRFAENTTAEARAAKLVTANKTDRIIEFPNGGLFGIYSADNEDAIRGEAFHLVILDEAARIPESAWQDAIQPTLADHGGEAILISTPKGLNWFYSEWQRGQENREGIKSWRASSYRNPNPLIKRAFRLARERVPDRTFRQEWLAEFVADGSYFQGVDQAATTEMPEAPGDHPGHTFYMSADWGLSNDYTVLAVGCAECGRVVDWDRFTNLDFTYQRERVYSLAERWHVQEFLPERNSFGEPNIEIVMARVNIQNGPDGRPGFQTTATSKPGLIQSLANGLEHGGFLVPKAAADELRTYEVETLAGGHPRFSAPEGQHDDWVMALALLYRAMTAARVQVYL